MSTEETVLSPKAEGTDIFYECAFRSLTHHLRSRNPQFVEGKHEARDVKRGL